jgi:hypothetical protein
LSPADGNLILSVRHQDWVIKIDYENGGGDGHIIWKLGQDGDFSVNSTDPSPWFSHQHNVHYIDDSTLILFDNGNTRRASDPNAHSRGQVWRLDEQTMTATLLLNADLGNSSDALGAAQRLSNGNFSFTSGFQGQPPNQFGQTIEVLPDGTKSYVLEVNLIEYRSYRIRTLYEGISDQLAANDGGTSETDSRRRHDHDRSSGAVEPTLPGRPPSDAFWAAAAMSLAAAPGQWAAPVTNPAATTMSASTAPLAPVSETDADPASQDVAALAAAAARDAWLADPAKDLWDGGL